MNPLPTLFLGKKNKGTICSNSPHEKMESRPPGPPFVMIVDGLVREVTGGLNHLIGRGQYTRA